MEIRVIGNASGDACFQMGKEKLDIKEFKSGFGSLGPGYLKGTLRFYGEGENGFWDYAGEVIFNAFNLREFDFDPAGETFANARGSKSLLKAMRGVGADQALYYELFHRTFHTLRKEAMEDGDKALTFAPPYLVSLDRVFLEPEYRRHGIGTFIHQNLYRLLWSCFRISAPFVVGLCRPNAGEGPKILQAQKKLLKDQGAHVFKYKYQTCFAGYIFDPSIL